MSDSTKFDPKRYGREPALRLASGRVVSLPAPFDPLEVTLAGNAREFAGGVVALYDATSKTGMVYLPAQGRWSMMQPIERDEFDAALAHGRDVEASLAPGSRAAH